MGVSRKLTDAHNHIHNYELFCESAYAEATRVKGKFKSGSRRSWGWDCMTCNSERVGFPTMFDAQTDCEKLHAEQHPGS